MPSVEISYVYEGIPFEEFSAYAAGLKKECLMSPERVTVNVEQEDESTHYTYTGQVRTRYLSHV